MRTQTLHFLTALILGLTFIACSDNKEKGADTKDAPVVKDATRSDDTATEAPAKAEDGPAIATIETDNYVAKVHRAIPFLPKDDGAGMFKVKDGHQFIVLDISIRNKSDKPIDMGQILLGAKTTDESGTEVGNMMAIAAYTYSNPNPGHQAQYDALWSTMKPGDFYRTTLLGLEAPKGAKSFSLSLKTKDDIFDKEKKEVQFSL